MNQRIIAFLFAASTVLAAAAAHAIPGLQIYIDGAIYDNGSETWLTGPGDFDLWVLGDGGHPAVKLTISYFGTSGTVGLTPKTTSHVTDPSTPSAPTFSSTGTGGHPTLPNHGIFNDHTLNHWDDYAIGDMTLTDSPIGDFSGSPAFPTSFPDHGQINVYRVHVTGWTRVHFDAYSSDGSKTPFSHDGEYNATHVGIESATWSAVKALFED